MIFFIGASEIFMLVVLLIVMISAAAETVAAIMGVLFALFLIKNLVLTIGIGYFKHKNSIKYTLLYLVMDITRVCLFFYFLNKSGQTFMSASGLGYFGALIGFVFYFLICGGIFGLGEIYSSLNHGGNEAIPRKFGVAADIFLVVLLAIVSWVGYL